MKEGSLIAYDKSCTKDTLGSCTEANTGVSDDPKHPGKAGETLTFYRRIDGNALSSKPGESPTADPIESPGGCTCADVRYNTSGTIGAWAIAAGLGVIIARRKKNEKDKE